MPVEVILPRVDMDMTQAKLTHWFVAEGASVAKGQLLFEIESDKAAMEVEAPASGVLRFVTAKAGETWPVGTVIGWIYAEGEAVVLPSLPPAAGRSAGSNSLSLVEAESAPHPDPLPASGERGAVALPRATPAARRLAREAGLELASLRGSGPLGRIQARDVPSREALNREWLKRGERAPLVLVHGFGGDLNVWRRWLNHIPRGRGALALDLPGHGRSPLGEITIAGFAEAVAATLTEEGVTRAHLVAHSLGAAVAAGLAARRPDLVASLTLIAPAGLGPGINGDFIAGFLAARSPAALRPWLAELTADGAALGEALAEMTLRQRRDLGVGEAQAKIADRLLPEGTQAHSARADLATYAGPVKAIFGRDDRILPVSHARALPGSVAVHILPGVGHMPHLEARDLVARLVRENAAAGEEI